MEFFGSNLEAQRCYSDMEKEDEEELDCISLEVGSSNSLVVHMERRNQLLF